MKIENCARCGEDHDDIQFEKFVRPIDLGAVKFEAWAPCPTTGQPIIQTFLHDLRIAGIRP
jgi:hypothetical protein